MTRAGCAFTYSTDVLMSVVDELCKDMELNKNTALWRISQSTYVVIDALGWRRSGAHDVVVVSMVDQEQAARSDTFLKVLNGQLLVTLIARRVQHVRERVTQTQDCVETVANQVLDVVKYGQPVCLFDHYVVSIELALISNSAQTNRITFARISIDSNST